MNVERLEKLRDHLKAVPAREFDMDLYQAGATHYGKARDALDLTEEQAIALFTPSTTAVGCYSRLTTADAVNAVQAILDSEDGDLVADNGEDYLPNKIANTRHVWSCAIRRLDRS